MSTNETSTRGIRSLVALQHIIGNLLDRQVFRIACTHRYEHILKRTVGALDG